MKWKTWQIDWPNHLIAFFSALFGILIAFELDEWRERKNEEEITTRAFEKLRQEVSDNRNVLYGTVNTNLELISLMETQLDTAISEKLLFNKGAAAGRMVNTHEQLRRVLYVDVPEDATGKGGEGYETHLSFQNFVKPVLHQSAWESARTVGALNNMSYEKVLLLSALYNPVQINEELSEIRRLLRASDNVKVKSDLRFLLSELAESYHLVQTELEQYDLFVHMLEQME